MSSNRRCEILKQHLDQLYEEYNAVVGQLGYTLNAGDRERLKQQKAHLDNEIEEYEEELSLCKLGAAEAMAQQRHRHLESFIPRIDFTEVFDTLTHITNRIQAEQGGAALLMLQNAHSMGGQWCIQRMKQFLSERTGDFRHYEIGLASGDRLDPWTFMRRLGGYLDCAPPGVAEGSPLQLQDYARSLSQTLEGAVQYGSIVLLEIRTWDHLALPGVFLPWFVREFWTPLVQRLPVIIQKNPLVTVICVVVALTPVQMEAFDPAMQCCDEDFDPAKMLPLPLRCWKQAEIYDWILRYSGLGASAIGVAPAQIAAMAESVYLASENGKPSQAYQALLNAIEEYYDSH